MKFTYTAITDDGNRVSGSMEADSKNQASQLLLSRGLIPQTVTQGDAGAAAKSMGESLANRFSSVKPQELILFTKQFRTMFRAGVPVNTLLKTLNEQTENPRLKKVTAAMSNHINEGRPLHEAFARHPDVFSPLYSNMIQAGETSGALPEVMDRLTYLLEHEFKVRSDIKSALQYPMLVVIALVGAFFVLLTFVIPKFASIFESAGLELPLPTLIAIRLYGFLSEYWLFCLGGTVITTIALSRFFKTKPGRLLRDRFFLRIPIIGSVLQKAAMSRFASIFAILQASGVSVLNSLDILSATIGNAAISHEFNRIKEQLTQGRGISGPLGSARYFTPMVVHMVAIGEESGNLDEMLKEVASHYDDEVGYAVSQMSTNLGPLLIVGLAAVVGFFALAIFLPMWDLTKMAG